MSSVSTVELPPECQPPAADEIEIKLEVSGLKPFLLVRVKRQELLDCGPGNSDAAKTLCSRYIHPCLWKLAMEMREADKSK